MCLKEVNNILNAVLEIMLGRNNMKRNQIIKTNTLNTIQPFLTFFTVISVLFDTLYIILFH